MVYKRLPDNTPQILRRYGLKVVEVDGWRNRGVSGEFNPVGVLCHHTATRVTSSVAAVLRLLRVGRSDLMGPLCQFGLGRDGTVYLIASGRANHGGDAKSSGTVAAGNANALYYGIEAFNDGVGEQWRVIQYNAYVLLCAVLSVEFTGNSHRTVRAHKETSVTGKIDPTFNMDTFRSKVEAMMVEIQKPAAPAPTPKPLPQPKPTPQVEADTTDADNKNIKDFRVHLVPGNKLRSYSSIVEDMKLVLANTNGNSAIVFNTERESDKAREAVSAGLGEGWTRVLDNENTIVYGSNWAATDEPSQLLLAKEDPSLARVSPKRYLNRVPLENELLKGTTVMFKGTHLLSEANCVHRKVLGRAWREKMWPIQLNDVIEDLQKDYDAGFPQVVAGDFNTGVDFNGMRLLGLLRDRFGNDVTPVHRGNLDHIFLISTDKVKLSEVGVQKLTDTRSDHDMITAVIRAEVL